MKRMFGKGKKGEFKATANQWEIFDAYKADQARQQREKDKAGKKVGRGKGDDDRSALLAKKTCGFGIRKTDDGWRRFIENLESGQNY